MSITATNPNARTSPGVKVTVTRDTRVPLHGPNGEVADIRNATIGEVYTVHPDTANNLFHAGAARPYADGDEKAPRPDPAAAVTLATAPVRRGRKK